MLSRHTVDYSIAYSDFTESRFETVVPSPKWSEVTTLALPLASIVK